jgi:PAS domain S-box-containing protein
LSPDRDALDRAEVLEKLGDSEQQLALLIESLDDYAIFSLSLDGTITSWNSGGEALFGYTPGDIIGRNFATLFTPEEIAVGLPQQQLTEATLHGCASVEFVLMRKDDSHFRASGKLNQLKRDSQGQSRGFVKIVRDISEQDALYQHERAWSLAFQRAVLPVELPDVLGLTFDALYEPGSSDAQVGGDWYDALRLLDGRVLVTIGDVAGRGLAAAVVVGVVRQIMRGIAQLHADPSIILDAADRALSLEYPDVYVTAWVAILDLVTRTITYANAGHPPTLLVGANAISRELGDSSLPIGLRDGKRSGSNCVSWSDGDTLVLYTDGLIEATHDILAGTALMAAAASAVQTAASTHPAREIKQLVIPNGSPDDVAVLVLRADFPAYEKQVDRWYADASDPVAGTVLREKFTSSLPPARFSAAEIADAELVFGELFGNIVRHAGTNNQAEIVVDHSGPRTVLHVLDHGVGFRYVSRVAPDPYLEHGRGLFLIAALTAEFTVEQSPDGGSHARAVLQGRLPSRLCDAPSGRSPALNSSAGAPQLVERGL